jgi:hypothetical protein
VTPARFTLTWSLRGDPPTDLTFDDPQDAVRRFDEVVANRFGVRPLAMARLVEQRGGARIERGIATTDAAGKKRVHRYLGDEVRKRI